MLHPHRHWESLDTVWLYSQPEGRGRKRNVYDMEA